MPGFSPHHVPHPAPTLTSTFIVQTPLGQSCHLDGENHYSFWAEFDFLALLCLVGSMGPDCSFNLVFFPGPSPERLSPALLAPLDTVRSLLSPMSL